MRKIHLVGLLIAFSLEVSAQYLPVLEGDTIIQKVTSEVLDFLVESEVYIYGDTLINGTSYRFVSLGALEYYIPQIVVGYAREDTLSGRVWFKRKRDGLELIVTDMGLAVGESIAFFEASNCYLGESIVTSVASEAGRKYINFDCDLGFLITDSLQYVEAIGATWSHFYQSLELLDEGAEAIYRGYGFRVCEVFRDGESIWAMPCRSGGVNTTSVNRLEISVQPNPTMGMVNIISPATIQSSWVYSLAGNVVLKQAQGATIDLSGLPSGFYHWSFSIPQARGA